MPNNYIEFCAYSHAAQEFEKKFKTIVDLDGELAGLAIGHRSHYFCYFTTKESTSEKEVQSKFCPLDLMVTKFKQLRTNTFEPSQRSMFEKVIRERALEAALAGTK